MTRDEIIKFPWGDDLEAWLEARDAEQVAGDISAYVAREVAAEREACAKACEEVDANPHVVLHHAVVCAAAIRARGKE